MAANQNHIAYLNPLLRTDAVLEARGVKKSQHYADVHAGLFTKPVKIGPRASAWPASEVAELNKARIAGKSDEEIRQLVTELEAARTAPSKEAA